MPNSSIWTIDRTLSGATTPGQGGPGSDGHEGVLCIPQISRIIEVSPSDRLVSYLGHSLGEFYSSAVPADWVELNGIAPQWTYNLNATNQL